MAAKLSNETCVHYHVTISEQVKKETQTKTNYDQFYTQYSAIYCIYAFRLLQDICVRPIAENQLLGGLETFENVRFLLFQ